MEKRLQQEPMMKFEEVQDVQQTSTTNGQQPFPDRQQLTLDNL